MIQGPIAGSPLNRRLAIWVCSALLLGATLLWLRGPAPAKACLSLVEFGKYDAIANVDRAERLLAEGRAVRAFQMARRARRLLQRDAREAGDRSTQAVIEHATLVTALAVVRLDGNAPITAAQSRSGTLRGRQDRSLRWALARLRERSVSHPSELRSQTRYAEALARFSEHASEARAILLPLSERDLMPEPQGYAALARILNPNTERDLFNAALSRCQQMAAGRADRVCPSTSLPPRS